MCEQSPEERIASLEASLVSNGAKLGELELQTQSLRAFYTDYSQFAMEISHFTNELGPNPFLDLRERSVASPLGSMVLSPGEVAYFPGTPSGAEPSARTFAANRHNLVLQSSVPQDGAFGELPFDPTN